MTEVYSPNRKINDTDSPNSKKRKRNINDEESIHPEKVRSPNKRRQLINFESLKIFSSPKKTKEDLNTPVENNDPNSPLKPNSPHTPTNLTLSDSKKRRSIKNRLKAKLLKESTLPSILHSPKSSSSLKEQSSSSSSLLSPNLEIDHLTSPISENRKRNSLIHIYKKNNSTILESPRMSNPSDLSNLSNSSKRLSRKLSKDCTDSSSVLNTPTTPVRRGSTVASIPVIGNLHSSITHDHAHPMISRSISMASIPKPDGSTSYNPPLTPKGNKMGPSYYRPPPKSDKKKKRTMGSLSLRSKKLLQSSDFLQNILELGSSNKNLKDILNSLYDHNDVKKEAPVKASVPQKYFGQPLDVVMKEQQTIDDLLMVNLSIPFIVHHCSFVIQKYYLFEEGIFRVSPSFSILEELQAAIEVTDDFGKSILEKLLPNSDRNNNNNADNADESSESDAPKLNPNSFRAHLYSGLLKKFLRDLPDPLLTKELYDNWISCGKALEETTNEDLKSILRNDMPKSNYYLLKSIILLCTSICEHSSVNKMTSDNLSRVIGPSVLWNNSLDALSSTEHISIINSTIRHFIDNYRYYFVDEETKEEEEITQSDFEQANEDDVQKESSDDNDEDIKEQINDNDDFENEEEDDLNE